MTCKQIRCSVFLACATSHISAQKITLGNSTTADGGHYNGELVAGKPQGKGKATYKNGN